MDDDLSVVVGREAGRCRIRISGDLTAFTCTKLSDAVNAAVADGVERVDLDLAEIDFMDSSGVQCLVQVRSAAEDSGAALAVVALTDRVERILEITGLLRAFRPDPA